MQTGLHIKHEGRTTYIAPELVSHPHTFTISADDGLPAGTHLRVLVGGFRTVARRMQTVWEYLGARVESTGNKPKGQVSVNREAFTDFWGMQAARLQPARRQHFWLVGLRLDDGLEGDSRLMIELKGRVGGYGTAPLDGFLQVEIQTPESKTFVPLGGSVILHCVPGVPRQVEIRTKPMPNNAGQVSAAIFCVDELLNPSLPTSGQVRLEAVGALEGLPAALDWNAAIDGRLALHGLRVTGDQPARIRVIDEATGTETLSQAILPGPIDGQHHYFGAIHFHTESSGDGDRGLWQAYAYARDLLMLDVATSADHNPMMDWPRMLATDHAFDEPGRFCTLTGWEANGTNGHNNIYLRSPETNLGPHDASLDWTAPSRLDGPDDAIIIPHATNVPGHPSVDWSIVGNRVRLVEMLQVRGCSEHNTPDDYWRINPRGAQDASVRAALAAGVRLGFVAGTDNHVGFPTRSSYPTTPDGNMEYTGLTGFVAPRLDHETIWDAMNARHTYATSGVPILCHFAVNRALMGSEIVLTAGKPLHFEARLHGTAPIERVEIISDAKCVRAYDVDSLDVTLNDELPAPAGNGSYYYLRLRQQDGHRAWASPIWVDLA